MCSKAYGFLLCILNCLKALMNTVEQFHPHEQIIAGHLFFANGKNIMNENKMIFSGEPLLYIKLVNQRTDFPIIITAQGFIVFGCELFLHGVEFDFIPGNGNMLDCTVIRMAEDFLPGFVNCSIASGANGFFQIPGAPEWFKLKHDQFTSFVFKTLTGFLPVHNVSFWSDESLDDEGRQGGSMRHRRSSGIGHSPLRSSFRIR